MATLRGRGKSLFQVITGVVFAEPAQTANCPTIRQYDLQTHDQIAGRAITQDIGTAGVCGNIAPQLAASLGRETQGKQSIGLFRGGLHGRQQAPRFRRYGVIGGI